MLKFNYQTGQNSMSNQTNNNVISAAAQSLFHRLNNWVPTLSNECTTREIPQFSCAIGSTIGLVRKQNEDQLAVIKAHVASSPKNSFVMFAVLDGMGGLKQGAKCAKIALSAFAASMVFANESSLREQTRAALHNANRTVYDQFHGGGGTTIAALIVNQYGDTVVANVGDSRIYSFSREKKSIRQISIDDTLAYVLEQANPNKFDELKPRADNQLIQFLGMGSDLEPHIIEEVNNGETGYLLATDGAYRMPAAVYENVVFNASSPKDVTQRLLKVADWTGGHDNASIVCLWPSPRKLKEVFDQDEVSNIRFFGVTESLELQGQISPKTSSELSPNEEIPPKLENPYEDSKRNKTRTKINKKKKNSKKTTKQEQQPSQIEIKLIDDK